MIKSYARQLSRVCMYVLLQEKGEHQLPRCTWMVELYVLVRKILPVRYVCRTVRYGTRYQQQQYGENAGDKNTPPNGLTVREADHAPKHHHTINQKRRKERRNEGRSEGRKEGTRERRKECTVACVFIRFTAGRRTRTTLCK